MKKSKLAFDAWKAATAAARAKSEELAVLGREATADEVKALNALIDTASAKKDDYQREKDLEAMEDAQEAEEAHPGRKARNNGGNAPAIIGEGRLGQSKGLSFAKVWRTTNYASGNYNRAIFREQAPEELEISDRLKKAGYHPEHGNSILMPLDHSLLIEPEDEEGRKLADFGELRQEIKERLALECDPGELAHLLRRNGDARKAYFGGEVKADMLLGDDAFGGQLVPETRSGRIIDLFRARSVLMRAGMQEIALPPSGNLSFPKLNSDPSFSYTDPDTTSDGSTSQVGTGLIRLQAKSLRGYVGIPNDLLRYSSPSAEMVVRAAMAGKAAQTADNALLESVGSSIAPKGLITYSPSTEETPTAGRITLHVAQTVAADGNTLEPEDIALIQGLYWEGNDPDEPTAWIMRPMLWSVIQNRRADAVSAGDGNGPFLFSADRGMMGNQPPTRLGGVPVFQTTQATRNRAKGAATNLHYIVYGNFRRLIHGLVGVLEIAISEHVKFLQDKTIIRAIYRHDGGLEHEESFVFTDTLVQA